MIAFTCWRMRLFLAREGCTNNALAFLLPFLLGMVFVENGEGGGGGGGG